ncbi:MAG: Ldh family oxidoreductase [Ruminococcaceae bacterium]|nr:Ldh family oxidoreductase [Oscillospiraceae bacterium]
MADMKFSYETLNKFCIDAFGRFGFSAEESKIITDVLLLSDLYGIESHGTQRIARYHKNIVDGEILIDRKPEIVKESPVSAVIDGHDGMGQVIGHFAMELAIRKAKESGIGMVVARNSNHYGIAGYYAKMACDQGLIGISMTNTAPLMVPTFGSRSMLGTNPMAVSMPADPYPFFFDVATTVVTRGKVEVYNKLEKPMPEGWAIDSTGKVSSDASRVISDLKAKTGGILPLGGATEKMGSHKGYGFGMIVELFTGIIGLSNTSAHTYEGGKGKISHSFIAIDPSIFGDPAEIKAHLSNYLEELRNSPKAEGETRIYTHGEKEIFAMADRMENGINVNVKTVKEMKELAVYLGMDVKAYLGEEAAAL